MIPGLYCRILGGSPGLCCIQGEGSIGYDLSLGRLSFIDTHFGSVVENGIQYYAASVILLQSNLEGRCRELGLAGNLASFISRELDGVIQDYSQNIHILIPRHPVGCQFQVGLSRYSFSASNFAFTAPDYFL